MVKLVKSEGAHRRWGRGVTWPSAVLNMLVASLELNPRMSCSSVLLLLTCVHCGMPCNITWPLSATRSVPFSCKGIHEPWLGLSSCEGCRGACMTPDAAEATTPKCVRPFCLSATVPGALVRLKTKGREQRAQRPYLIVVVIARITCHWRRLRNYDGDTGCRGYLKLAECASKQDFSAQTPLG